MDIKNDVKEAFVENKKIFLVLLILFLLGFIIAWVFADDIAPVFLPLLKEALLGENVNSINAFYIISNNLTSAIITFTFSIFFGISSVISMFVNGFAIGFTCGYTVKSFNSLIMFLVLIVPHGIFEIPAMFCNGTSGILLFLFIFRVLKDFFEGFTIKEGCENNIKTLKHSIILFLITIMLFVIAGLIEGLITPQLGNMVSMQLNGTKLF